MARSISLLGSYGVKSYKPTGQLWAEKTRAKLNSTEPTYFPSAQVLTLKGVSFDASGSKLVMRYNDGRVAGLEVPTVTAGTALLMISNGVIQSGYEDAFSSVSVGTTSLPPSTSENRTWAYKYVCNMEGTIYIRGNGQATGSMVSGNDRAIYIMKNGVQLAAAGSSTSTNNWATVQSVSVAVGDVIQFDIRDVYWRYSAGGVAAVNCEIFAQTYS